VIEIREMEVVKLATFPSEGSYIALSTGKEIYSILTDEPINAVIYKLSRADSITLHIEPDSSKILTVVEGELYEIEGLAFIYSSVLQCDKELEEEMQLIG